MDKGVGKGAALNSAVKKATGEILFFMDEDMTVRSDTISKVCSALNGYQTAIGYNLPSNKGGIVSRIARMYLSFLPKVQAGTYNLIGTTFAGGRNFAIYKKTLRKAGGFRNVLTEDIELSLRLFMKGFRVRAVKAIGYEQVPFKFSWYLKQQQRWNVGAGQVLREWDKRFHHHDIVLAMFLVMTGLIGPMSFLFLVLALVFNSWLFFSVTLLGFLICLSGALDLDKDDIVLSPLTFFVFIVVQTIALFYSEFSKPKKWYRTPKSGD